MWKIYLLLFVLCVRQAGLCNILASMTCVTVLLSPLWSDVTISLLGTIEAQLELLTKLLSTTPSGQYARQKLLKYEILRINSANSDI